MTAAGTTLRSPPAAPAAPGRAAPVRTPLVRTALGDAVRDRLYFAQVREDPRAELEALSPGPRDVVVVVSSGGCTALSLLAAGAGRVVCVDRNRTQNHLVELKAAAPVLGAADAVGFLGAAPDWLRATTYHELRPLLSPGARRHWDGRPADVARGVLSTGVSERFIAAVVGVLRRCVHPPARVDHLLACRTMEEQRALFAREWDTRRWRALFALLCNRWAFRRSYPAAFFRGGTVPGFAAHFRRLAEHALTELPVADNYFLHQMLTGRYPTEASGGVPPYLTPAGAQTVAAERERLELVDGGMTAYLRTRPDGSVSCFALSNICEWMDASEVRELFGEVLRTAAPGARLVFRNFVGWTELPHGCERIAVDHALGDRLTRADRSVVQARVVACRISAPA